jgi:hypothetical protein
MTKVLIDMALIAIAALAGGSIISSGRMFATLFSQLRAEMAAGLPVQVMQVSVRSTTVESTLGSAAIYQPVTGVANNPAGTLSVRSRMRRRSAAMRAAA